MATYKEIQEDVRKRCGISIKTCWIADVKRRHGLTTRIAPNRIDPAKPKHPCPDRLIPIVKESLNRFGCL